MQGIQELRIAKIDAGEDPEPSRRKYRDYESRLRKLVDDFSNDLEGDAFIRYIRSIASVLKFDITSK